jgi:hypothetical protein
MGDFGDGGPDVINSAGRDADVALPSKRIADESVRKINDSKKFVIILQDQRLA